MASVSVNDALSAVVTALGGEERPGQIAMAEAVTAALDNREHLLVEAGTGTGKSVGYIVPSLLHGKRVVVATATIALQRQLVHRDLPRIAEALTPVLGRRPTFAVLKGRHNFLCVERLNRAIPTDEPEPALFDSPTTKLGKQAAFIRQWADETETGDRDDLEDPIEGQLARQALAMPALDRLVPPHRPFPDGQAIHGLKIHHRPEPFDVIHGSHEDADSSRPSSRAMVSSAGGPVKATKGFRRLTLLSPRPSSSMRGKVFLLFAAPVGILLVHVNQRDLFHIAADSPMHREGRYERESVRVSSCAMPNGLAHWVW